MLSFLSFCIDLLTIKIKENFKVKPISVFMPVSKTLATTLPTRLHDKKGENTNIILKTIS
jgi:hypothetical protein